MRFPDGMETVDFLRRHWQKRPLFMRDALEIEPELDPDELAWLATQDDVESRLVFTERDDKGTRYRVRHGPFEEAELAALPDRDWTLLVQDVDKHLPDFREFFRHCEFVPDWRVDDIMVSFAAPGGSVGPHRDNYDVFLVQGSGSRDWRVALGENVFADETNAEMALLQAFSGDSNCMAARNDVLYLPPGVAHWGIARDRCMTYSIGMRAPELAEFNAAAERLYPGRVQEQDNHAANRIFYQDPDLDLNESAPGLIAAASLLRARRQFDVDTRFNDDGFARIFGSLLTDPKAWLEPERPDEEELRNIDEQLSTTNHLPVHGMARIAHTADSGEFRLFVNGFDRKCPLSASAAVMNLCAQRGLRKTEIARWQRDPHLGEILDWLLRHGTFDTGTG